MRASIGARVWIGFALLMAHAAGPASAQPSWTYNTLDWLIECKRHIAIGRLVSWQDRNPQVGRTYGVGVVRVGSALKGRPPREATVSSFRSTDGDPDPREDLLLFFDDSLRVDYAVSLGDTLLCEPAIAQDQTLIRGRREILSAVRRRLSRMRREGRGAPGTAAEARDRERYLELPIPGWPVTCSRDPNPPKFGDVVDYVIVPADSEYLSLNLRRLRLSGVHPRAAAALTLGLYPGRTSVEALQSVLRDSATDTLTYYTNLGEKRVVGFFPVRQAAYLSLRRIGVNVPQPEGYVDDPYVEYRIGAYLGNDS